jgi:hypothetical protein
MHRVDGPGNVAGHWVSEDPVNEIPGTEMTADWFEAVQEEIAAVVESRGKVLNKANNHQLLESIMEIASGADLIARYATTGNIVLNGDAVQAGGDWPAVLPNGTIVLVRAQTIPQDNGPYVVNATGAWSRLNTFDSSAEIIPGKTIKVTEGVTLADSIWMLVTDAPIVLNSTALVFERKDKIPTSTIRGAFKNLKLSANGTSAVVNVTIDEIVTGDGAGNYLSTRNWNSSLDMTVSGAGGLDVGAVAASTWYYIFAITKDDGTKSLLASLSATNPTLPAGYNKSARIGSLRTDGTANKYPLSFIQAGRNVIYKTAAGSNVTKLPTMVSGVQGSVPSTFASVSTANFVPPTATAIKVAGWDVSGTGIVIIAPNNTYAYQVGATITGNPAPYQFNGSGTSASGAVPAEFLLESTNIFVITGASSVVVNCIGWEDSI